MFGAAGKVKRPSRLKIFLEKKRQAKLACIPKTLDTSAQVDGISLSIMSSVLPIFFLLQPIDVTHIYVADLHEARQERKKKLPTVTKVRHCH